MSEHPDQRPERDVSVDEEEAAAAREAAAIGGPDPQPGADPAERPLVEGGEGYAEGFDLAEHDLEANASHESRGADPAGDAGRPEPDSDEAGAEYGEADHTGAQGEEDAV
jgi:hypothetical protein